MVRLTKSKEHVDLAPNTIRHYATKGLRLYRVGKAVFFSTAELEAFIRQQANGGEKTIRQDKTKVLPQPGLLHTHSGATAVAGKEAA